MNGELAESKVSGLDKASALLLGLGVELSSKVLQYLSEGEIERVLLALGRTIIRLREKAAFPDTVHIA